MAGETKVCAKASVVKVRDQFVMARYGRTQRERYRAETSPALLDALTTTGDRWVDFSLFVEATELVCVMFGEGDSRLAEEIGAFAAEANMGPWRSLAHRLLSPRTILGLAPKMWSHHYDAGRAQIEILGPTSLTMTIEDFPRPTRVHCRSVLGWCRRVIELGRPRRADVELLSCRAEGDDSCRIQASWR